MKKKTIIILLLVLMSIPFLGTIHAYEYNGIDIYGFISQGYIVSTDNNFLAKTEEGTTQFNEMGINFSTDISNKLRLGIQFMARDLGTIGNNEVVLDWAIADFRWRDYLGLLVGDIKLSHGLYNEIRDVDMLRTNIFLPQSVYNEAWREIITSIQGGGLYGDVSLDTAGSISYIAQYGTSHMAPNKGAARLLEDQWPLSSIGSIDVNQIDTKYFYTGSVRWDSMLDGLVLGTSTWGYKFDSEADTLLDGAYASTAFAALGVELPITLTTYKVKADSCTGSLEYTWRNLILAAEYTRITYNISFANDLFTNSAVAAQLMAGGADLTGDMVKVPRFSSMGYYGSMAYRFKPWLEVGTYYSVYYADEDDKDGYDRTHVKGLDKVGNEHRGWLKDICLTLRFDIQELWVLKFEGHKMDGAAIMLGYDNPVDSTDPNEEDRYEEDWYMLAAKLTYNF